MKKFLDESWLVLVMGIVFALLLAGTQASLQGKIKANKEAELADAIMQSVPGTAEFKLIETEAYEVFRCSGEGDETVGYAVVAEGPGFVDKIRLVTGLNSDLSEITGIKVIENVETPGLGNKIEKNKFADQYIGMTLETEIKVKKGGAVNDNNEIDAITGATWSSKYVTAIVNEVRTEAVPVIRETLQ